MDVRRMHLHQSQLQSTDQENGVMKLNRAEFWSIGTGRKYTECSDSVELGSVPKVIW